MVPVVAKKYTKALLETSNDDEIKKYYSNLKALSDAYSLEKMKNILLSPTISKKEKFEFIISLIEDSDKKFNNFIRILVDNDRMYLVPAICDELRYRLSIKENKFIGHIISHSEIDGKSKKNIEEKLSNKFNSSIILKNIKSDYPGIKIEIEDLGVEISFSIDRLKAQMTEHILKAI